MNYPPSTCRSKPKMAAAIVLGFCIVTFALIVDEPSSSLLMLSSQHPDSEGRHRSLRVKEEMRNERRRQREEERQPQRRMAQRGMVEEEATEEEDDVSIYPWAKDKLVPATTAPDPAKEQALFWHIPKSGGTTIKELYRCLNKASYQISKLEDAKRLVVAQEYYIMRSKEWDILHTSSPANIIETLVNEEHPGRVLSLFRHPVERLVSKFYYLQKAKWERTYQPEWKSISLLEWATNHNHDNNHYVKKLANKTQIDTATETDLEFAKHTIKSYFIVGLTNQMKESTRRFNVILGIDDVHDKRHAKCMKDFFRDTSSTRLNSNIHPEIEKDDPAYQLLAEKNSLDIQLYEYIEELFRQQKEQIFDDLLRTKQDAELSPSDSSPMTASSMHMADIAITNMAPPPPPPNLVEQRAEADIAITNMAPPPPPPNLVEQRAECGRHEDDDSCNSGMDRHQNLCHWCTDPRNNHQVCLSNVSLEYKFAPCNRWLCQDEKYADLCLPGITM